MRGLSWAAAGRGGRGSHGVGGLGGQVPVSGGLQEAPVGVLLHQGSRLPLSHVETRSSGSLQIRPSQLPGLVVYVHLWEGGQACG